MKVMVGIKRNVVLIRIFMNRQLFDIVASLQIKEPAGLLSGGTERYGSL